MTILLAPMEGLLDCTLRDALTQVGGVQRCVSEFIRVTDHLLPLRSFTRVAPELLNGGFMPAGVPLRPQLLCRSEERRVGKECRSRWSPYH